MRFEISIFTNQVVNGASYPWWTNIQIGTHWRNSTFVYFGEQTFEALLAKITATIAEVNETGTANVTSH